MWKEWTTKKKTLESVLSYVLNLQNSWRRWAVWHTSGRQKRSKKQKDGMTVTIPRGRWAGSSYSFLQEQINYFHIGRVLLLCNQEGVGRTNAAQHGINTGGATPFLLLPYRVPKAWEEKVRLETRPMLHLGVIEPSTSPWASPIMTEATKKKVVYVSA